MWLAVPSTDMGSTSSPWAASVLGLTAFLNLSGCSLQAQPSGASVSPSAPAKTTASPPASTPSPGWQRYVHPRLGYSFDHPTSWLELGSRGGSDSAVFLSNESVSRPADLGPEGIWMSVSVIEGAPCPSPPFTSGSSTMVDGVPSMKYLFRTDPPPGGRSDVWGITVLTPRVGGCYQFQLLTISEDNRKVVAPTLDTLLRSFHFPSP